MPNTSICGIFSIEKYINMRKIFIIADNANILYGLQAKLNVEGHSTFLSSNDSIENVLRQINLVLPEIIILNLELASINGFKLVSEIKSKEELSNLSIFIYSDLSDPINLNYCENLGLEYCFDRQNILLDDFIIRMGRILQNNEKLKDIYEVKN